MSDKTQDTQIPEPEARWVVLVVPKQHVKTVKSALEQHGKLDQTAKITPHISTGLLPNIDAPFELSKNGEEIKESSKQEEIGGTKDRMRIPTTILYRTHDESASENTGDVQPNIFHDLGLSHISREIDISYHTPAISNGTPALRNPLHKALKAALNNLDPSILTNLNLKTDALSTSFPEGYSIYPPLLLLPHNAFSSPTWTLLLAAHPPSSTPLRPLWHHLAISLKVTHIAINSPIPLTQSSSSSSNILRSPINITPLHGDFGPLPTPQTLVAPTQADFDAALWVTAVQNGIHQTWAPLYTMFSRGNIREKTRLLHLPSITSLSHPTTTAAVVDMYAGIGYFAFSYRAAGMRPVIGFELNPWSVEGLRRGAERNGWNVKIYLNGEDGGMDMQRGGDVDFLVYQMSNAHALSLLQNKSKAMPPIRHINLGLLPHSRDSWRDAVGLLDRKAGGWVHAHENVGVGEIDSRKGEIEGVLRGYVDELIGGGRKVEVEHVERVKMYAPGVVHCVFDVRVGGKGGKELEGR